jgi:Skp family chaperone for outer membrane proteins
MDNAITELLKKMQSALTGLQKEVKSLKDAQNSTVEESKLIKDLHAQNSTVEESKLIKDLHAQNSTVEESKLIKDIHINLTTEQV